MLKMFTVPEDVKESTNEIIVKYSLDPKSKITYNIGSEIGEGYLSKTYAINIEGTSETVYVFLKCAINKKYLQGTNLGEILYTNEREFYELIVPCYLKFLHEKGLEDSFGNVPKYYATSNKNILAFENLKRNGYRLCDKVHIANDEHMALVFKTYAKFHAVSFAYKNQRTSEYEETVRNVRDLFTDSSESFRKRRREGVVFQIKNFMKSLDPIKDKYILDRREYILERLIKFNENLSKIEYENSIITHGDCWCNNILFLYKENKKTPIDAMLIDWQVIRSASPVFDLSYFFYTAASVSKMALCKFKYFLQLYHEELSEQIRKMGSDPDLLYPFATLEQEWRKFCIFGYSMAFMIVRAMLYSKDEVPNLEEVGFRNIGQTFTEIRKWGEYVDRLRNLTYHFLQNKFI